MHGWTHSKLLRYTISGFFSSLLDIDCPESCGGKRTIVLGAVDLAKQLTSGGFQGPNEAPVNEAAFLITMESVFHPGYVSPPLSILELDRRGAHWAPKYRGRCPQL